MSTQGKYFRNNLAEFIFYRTYSRWIEEENRRESWIECVDRYMDFMKKNLGRKLTGDEYGEIREAIVNQEVMPSMRLMWSAGKMAETEPMAGYNCTFTAIESPRDLAEILYILMCGTGCGFSVEKELIEKFPTVSFKTGEVKKHKVKDSREGWAEALEIGLTQWMNGTDVIYDFSKLRPKGARLMTMGGRSSGPEPLEKLLSFAKEKILTKQGEKLRPIDVHDIACKIGECIVAGGVRRSALISLSDLGDENMRDAKKGEFWIHNPERSLSNNSTIYKEKPGKAAFDTEWEALKNSGSGERGIFNRQGVKTQSPERRDTDTDHLWGTNPCGEIYLRSKQMCNLSEVIVRKGDTETDLLRKIRLATIIGTYQSTLTDFEFLSEKWKENGEEERLLGVSMTGIWDHPDVNDGFLLAGLQDYSISVNKEYASRFGVGPSAAITAVKPSGSVSQLTDTSSGMHPRHSEYYVRRVRIAATDPLFALLSDAGMKSVPEVGQNVTDASTWVLEFPIKSPEGSVYKDDLTALQQLHHWLLWKKFYTEHNPSVTISVGEDEWDEVREWVWSNWEDVGGLSFLPRTDHVYKLAPYEELTKEQYEDMVAHTPDIDYSRLMEFEVEDTTEGAKSLACVAGLCAI